MVESDPPRPFRPRAAGTVRPSSPDGDMQPSGPARVPRPALPPDLKGTLPRGLRRTIQAQVPDVSTARDVQRAVSLAIDLLDDGNGQEAIPLLVWAKSLAPRVADIREALGVAHYLTGAFQDALNELRTYRRMAASHDQDHLIADCLRGLGHPVGEVAGTVKEMLASDGVPAQRQVEGLLVWAGALRDAGDLAGARSVIRRVDHGLLQRADDQEVDQRVTWLTAELAAADGDLATARDGYATLAALPGDPWDARAPLAKLG